MKLAVITCHYNWFGFQRPRDNLRQFLDAMQGLPLFGVEAHLPGHPVQTSGLPGWRQVEATQAQVMMQKESLLNLAAREVPAEYEALVWIDADIIFENPDWYVQTARMLDMHPIVQPFSKARWLDRDSVVLDERPGIATAPDRLHRCLAHPGFAMAARRSLWRQDRAGLYDALVVGNGDVGFAAAALDLDQPGHLQMNPQLKAHYETWSAPVRRWIKGRPMGFVHGVASHLWHGDIKDRRYLERNAVLIRTLDPARHLSQAQNGLQTWTEAAPFGLRYAIRSHFANRREDG